MLHLQLKLPILNFGLPFHRRKHASQFQEVSCRRAGAPLEGRSEVPEGVAGILFRRGLCVLGILFPRTVAGD